MCEFQFEREHRRKDDDRYSIILPIKPYRENFGNSKEIATQRLLSLKEQRFVLTI